MDEEETGKNTAARRGYYPDFWRSVNWVIGFVPLHESVWMTEKLTVLAYIALGFVALHYSKGFLFRLIAFLGALGWVYAAAKLALTKTPQLLG